MLAYLHPLSCPSRWGDSVTKAGYYSFSSAEYKLSTMTDALQYLQSFVDVRSRFNLKCLYWLLCDVTERFGRYFWRALWAIFSSNFSIKIEAGAQREEQGAMPLILCWGETGFAFSLPNDDEVLWWGVRQMSSLQNSGSPTQVREYWRQCESHTLQEPRIGLYTSITAAELYMCSGCCFNDFFLCV